MICLNGSRMQFPWNMHNSTECLIQPRWNPQTPILSTSQTPDHDEEEIGLVDPPFFNSS